VRSGLDTEAVGQTDRVIVRGRYSGSVVDDLYNGETVVFELDLYNMF
jgi:hypothetical protein